MGVPLPLSQMAPPLAESQSATSTRFSLPLLLVTTAPVKTMSLCACSVSVASPPLVLLMLLLTLMRPTSLLLPLEPWLVLLAEVLMVTLVPVFKLPAMVLAWALPMV